MSIKSVIIGKELLDLIKPLVMREEARQAIEQGREISVEYTEILLPPESTKRYLIYFPTSGRGGVCEEAFPEWTSCTSLEDLLDKYKNKVPVTRWVAEGEYEC